MKVSILVAVYNTAPYLQACLDSLLSQTHTDLEIICIDDASTDDSWQILLEYARRDNRVMLLQNQVNSGQAVARNRGLEIATGDYITMVDSDDWLALDAIEKMCLAVGEGEGQVDCVLFELFHHEDQTGREWRYCYRTEQMSFTSEEAFLLSLDWSIHGVYMLEAGLHKRIPYDTSHATFSDDNTTRLHYLHSVRGVRRATGVYYYRQRATSVSNRIDASRVNLVLANWDMRKQLCQLSFPQTVLAKFETHRWLNFVGMTVFYFNYNHRFTDAERQAYMKILREILTTFDISLISSSIKKKFGYRPCRLLFFPFCLQVRIYAFLRRLLRR